MDKEKKFALSLIIVILLVCAGATAIYLLGNREQEEEPIDEIIYYRMDTAEGDSDLLTEFAGENIELYYNTDFVSYEGAKATELYALLDVVEDTTQLKQATASRLSLIDAFVIDSERFSETSTNVGESAIAISAMADTQRESFSATFYLDGTIHAVYRIGWGSPYRVGISADGLATQLSYFSGLDITAEDVSTMFQVITERGLTGGNYTVYVSDKWSYNYLAYTVKGYNTGTEYWECYVSVTNKYE